MIALRLYVSGLTPRSKRAILIVEDMLTHLRGNCDLQVIDLSQTPYDPTMGHIDVLPTLKKITPLPTRRMVGDFQSAETILNALGLPARRRNVNHG